ncbi:MAG: hypothetical protein CME06_08785 [Gemmatimonadetes bacterium]|nr:hypothetical protein [Gemmatimonadota bacterium]
MVLLNAVDAQERALGTDPVQIRVEEPNTRVPWTPLASILCGDSPHKIMVGGLFYSGRYDQHLPNELTRISRFPQFCWFRLEPRELPDGTTAIPALYTGMPLMAMEFEGAACGLVFPPMVGSPGFPLGLRLVDDRRRLELGLAPSWRMLEKGVENYNAWNLEPLESVGDLALPAGPIDFEVQRLDAPSLDDLVQKYLLEIAAPRDRSIDLPLHARKALEALYQCFDIKTGLFLEWRRRDGRGFNSGFYGLPTFNTLMADLPAFARNGGSETRRMDAAAISNFTLPEASESVGGGRVWHNTFHRAWGEDDVRFFTHLGTGLAGYPGGQATILGAAAERLAAEREKSRTLAPLITAGATWLRSVQYSDGSWGRTYRVLAEELTAMELESGWGTASVGATAEGALALMRASTALSGPAGTASRSAAERALQWIADELSGNILMGGYLRDNRLEESDGISAVPVIEANLVGSEMGLEGASEELALRVGLYLATWQRWWHREYPSVDPLQISFKPRIAPWETVLAARAYALLYAATADDFWRRMATEAFVPIEVESELEGYSEAIYYDEKWGFHAHPMGTTYVPAAVLRFLRTWSETTHVPIPVIRVDVRPHRTGRTARSLSRGALRRLSALFRQQHNRDN